MYNGVYTKDQYAYMYDTMFKWVRLKVEGQSIGERLRKSGILHIALYGINDFGRLVYEDVKKDVCVDAFIDRRARETPIVEGVKVLIPEETKSLPLECFVLVTAEFFFNDITETLLQYGFDLDKIISIAMVLA